MINIEKNLVKFVTNSPSKAEKLAFFEDILEVYKKHRLTISHEDYHGAFEIVPYDNKDIQWLREALS